MRGGIASLGHSEANWGLGAMEMALQWQINDGKGSPEVKEEGRVVFVGIGVRRGFI